MKKSSFIFLVFVLLSCSKEKKYPTPDITEIYFQDGAVETVFENRTNGINVIFIGDGYVRRDLEKERGTYRPDAIKHIEFLFNNPPFSEYKQYFNAYIIYAESDDEGPNYDSRTKTTALGVIQGDPNPERYDGTLLTRYVKKIIPNFLDFSEKDIVLISVKNGKGGSFQGSALFSNSTEEIMLHEVGHFFSLADEYEKHPRFPLHYIENTYLYPNLDSIGDASKVKWKHFIGLENYESVGTYEGGGYTSQGNWRPQENSIMRESSGNYPFFNAPSREAIVKRILELNGLEYSFEEFLEKDKIALDTINTRVLSAKKSVVEFSCGYPVFLE